MKDNAECAYWAFEALVSGNGVINFDQLTKTKVVDEALSRMPSDSSAQILGSIKSSIIRPKVTDHLSAEASRRIAADLILSLVRKQTAADSPATTVLEACMILPELGCVVPTSDAESQHAVPALSKETQELFRTRTMSCIFQVLTARSEHMFLIPFNIVTSIHKMVKNGGHKLWLSLDKVIQKTVSDAVETTIELRESSLKKKKGQANGGGLTSTLGLLFALTILQVYSGDTDAVSLLEDLEACYESLLKKDKNASFVVVEILLSFLSKPSALFRKLAELVFAGIADQLPDEGLQSMLEVLEKRENLSGQQELFDQEDDEDEEDDEASEDEEDNNSDDENDNVIDGEDDSDVEMIDDEDDEGEDEDDSDEKEEDSDGEGSIDEEQQAFEAKLAQALGTSQASRADGDDVESSEDDSDMDDEQMMALDGHLTTIFKERTKVSSKKKDNRDAKENIVNFKNRVLDLLLIYAKSQHANPLVIRIILPIITLIRTTSARQTADKSFAVLKQLSDACNKDKQFPEVDEADLFDILTSVQGEMRANASKQHSTACGRMSLFLAKILVSKDASTYERIADSYAKLQKEWYSDPKSNIQANIFTEWTSWSIATRKR